MFDLDGFINSSFHYVSSGLFVSDGMWIHPTRVIEGYELIFVVKGTVLISEDGTDYMLSKNDALFLRPGIEHRGIRPLNEDISFYWVHFDFDTPVPLSQDGCQSASVKASSNMHILFRQLLHYANTKDYPKSCTEYLLRLIIIEVLLSIARPAAAGNALVSKIEQWIRIHYDKNITLDMVENQFNYNRDYLSRLFKQYLNIGIKQYIDKVKMDKAKEFIVSGYALSDIPAMLGIDSYNLFLKKFKYHEGISPKQFREAYTSLHLNKK